MPAPRSTLALAAAVARVIVSAPVPPMMVSVLATVAELVPLARVSESLPAPRSMNAFVTALLSTMVVVAGAAGDQVAVGELADVDFDESGRQLRQAGSADGSSKPHGLISCTMAVPLTVVRLPNM